MKQQMVEKWHAVFAKVNADVLFEAHDRYKVELEKISKVLSRFRTAHFEQADVNELGLYYAHLWLQAVDEHFLLGALKQKPHGMQELPGTGPEAVAGPSKTKEPVNHPATPGKTPPGSGSKNPVTPDRKEGAKSNATR
jgi:hypothetical protein